MGLNEVGKLSLKEARLGKKEKRDLFKVYFYSLETGTIDITHLVNEFFSSVELKTIKGEKYILNSTGMGISVYQCLKTKIELEGNKLAHQVNEI